MIDGHVAEKLITLDDSPVGREQFYITFNGAVFIHNGGYATQSALIQAESERMSNIEPHQAKANRNMLYLTSVIAFGTFVAALYYYLEIVRSDKEIHFASLVTSIFLFLAGAISTAILCLILLQVRQAAKEKIYM